MPVFSFLSRLGRQDVWKTRAFFEPWDGADPSIHDHIDALVTRGADPNETDLPDKARFSDGSAIQFAPGAMDHLFALESENAGAVAHSVQQLLRDPSPEAIATLYRQLMDERAIGLADGVMERLAQSPPNAQRFRIFFDWMMCHSPDREPVKFAISMLGMLEGEVFRSVFMRLGGHEEFTTFAAVALTNALPQDKARAALVEMAHRVHGWGRIDLVDRLAPQADEAFRHWLVREGFRNTILDAYLAYTAAQEGQLLRQLAAEGAAQDNALIDGAAGIFIALVEGGAAEDMSDYADGATAAFRWFDLLRGQTATLLRATAARALGGFAQEQGARCTWPRDAARAIHEQAAGYVAQSAVRDLVGRALNDPADPGFWMAKHLAPDLGIDPWPGLFAQQGNDPDAGLWYDLMRTDAADRVAQVATLATRQLPLHDIASGPGDEIGLGPEWNAHGALAMIVQDLDRFPGIGWPLIAASLQSPVIRNRNMAAKAMEGWPKATWPEGALATLRRAIETEPNADLKTRLEGLLNPEPQ